MNELETTAATLLESYRRSVFERDVDAFVGLYDPAVRVFDTWGAWSHEGIAAWRATVERWFGSLGDECVQVTFDGVQVVAGAELSLVTAFARYAAVAPDGRELRAMQNRLTWTIRSGHGVSRIVHEHTSAPIGDDTKAILRRS